MTAGGGAAPRQMAFDLPAVPAHDRANFFVTPANAAALAAIEGWAGWPAGRLLLTGPAGSGKTHLAHVWALSAGAPIVPAAALRAGDVPQLAAGGRVAVEDADAAAGQPAAEAALFHLHNHLAEVGGGLLLTARRPAAEWPLALPDLASRMQALPVARLERPDDALLAAVLVKLFADRGVAVKPSLIGWLLRRMERSLAAAGALVAALDARALAEGRPVSRALAAEVLDSLAGGGA